MWINTSKNILDYEKDKPPRMKANKYWLYNKYLQNILPASIFIKSIFK